MDEVAFLAQGWLGGVIAEPGGVVVFGGDANDLVAVVEVEAFGFLDAASPGAVDSVVYGEEVDYGVAFGGI